MTRSIKNTNININIISQSLRRNSKRKCTSKKTIKNQPQDSTLRKCNPSFKRKSQKTKPPARPPLSQKRRLLKPRKRLMKTNR